MLIKFSYSAFILNVEGDEAMDFKYENNYVVGCNGSKGLKPFDFHVEEMQEVEGWE